MTSFVLSSRSEHRLRQRLRLGTVGMAFHWLGAFIFHFRFNSFDLMTPWSHVFPTQSLGVSVAPTNTFAKGKFENRCKGSGRGTNTFNRTSITSNNFPRFSLFSSESNLIVFFTASGILFNRVLHSFYGSFSLLTRFLGLPKSFLHDFVLSRMLVL